MILDLLFYSFIKKSIDNNTDRYTYALRAFHITLFINLASIYLAVNAIFTIKNIVFPDPFFGFIICQVLSGLITYLMNRRRELIIRKFKSKTYPDLTGWWLGYVLFSLALFLSIIYRISNG